MKRCIVTVRAWRAEPLCDFLGVLFCFLLCCRSPSHYLWYIITFVYVNFFFFLTIITVTAWVLLYIQDKLFFFFFFLHQSCIMNTNFVFSIEVHEAALAFVVAF